MHRNDNHDCGPVHISHQSVSGEIKFDHICCITDIVVMSKLVLLGVASIHDA